MVYLHGLSDVLWISGALQILPVPRRLCFHLSLLVCVSVIKIIQEDLDKFSRIG